MARSNEAKELGVRMGHPWHEIRHLEKEAGLVALSANFALYGDMSDRMASLVAALGHRHEVYSIDESFVDLSGIRGDMTERAHAIRARVLQWVGIPCGVGIAHTKTLAKLANHVAKTAERKPGSYPAKLAQVCNLAQLPRKDLDAVLDSTDVGEVWGVGRKIAAQLKDAGTETVLDLARLDPAMVRRRWSVVLERTVRELQGMPCIGLEEQPPPKKEIACTRSFGQPIRDLQALEQAVSTFASMAAQKLRRQASHTAHVLVFIHTSPYRKGPQYARSITVPLLRATSDTVPVVNAALAGLRRIYRSGYAFIKAGVMLLDLHSAKLRQGELDLEPLEAQDCARERLMGVLDELNQRYGRGTVKLASAGVEATGERASWAMRQERRSPAYTTRWDDMLEVGDVNVTSPPMPSTAEQGRQ
ncbi:Y-family DNA polymerase [Acidovorax radicis]|uniref:Y-family DNA polymerase n=1 Tax=Acidovorax radicis TaxID=758826 RepID=UPI001CFBA4C4|nr:Y-family DNA polymerase [Acidovorax radicis]